MKKNLKYLLIVALGMALLSYGLFFWPVWGIPFQAQRHGRPPLTPAWALECWLWEDDHNTAGYVDTLLAGYAEHDIPVRTILLDSPWSLRYNDFEVDTSRYPDPARWFGTLQQQGYRVVLWMTSMVNSHSKDTFLAESEDWYEQARRRGYLTGQGTQIKWWKGRGGFIDYTNPAALRWWTSLQRQVLDYGIDGWKLDGTATLFRQQLGPVPLFYQKTYGGWLTTRQYMDLYYRQEYANGLKRNPEFVTLARAIDRGYHPEGFAPIDASPVNWVGDQVHHWKSKELVGTSQGTQKDIALDGIQGFESAIDNILKSARLGYNIVGSDVAGFSGATIPPRLYIRWAQFSAFCGLFLNGGHGERALWKRSAEELSIIRQFSWLHTELVPYMYSYVVSAHRGGPVLQRPVAGTYHYLFGDHLLVAPIYQDDSTRQVQLPEGTWRYWFDDREVHQGPVTFTKDFPLDEFPVYVREGAIVPLHVERNYTRLGDENSANYLTWVLYPDRPGTFTVYDPHDQVPTTLAVTTNPKGYFVQLSGKKNPHILRIHAPRPPRRVERDGQVLRASADYQYDAHRQKLIIRTDHHDQPGTYRIEP
ncbi:hypothetical protein GCM10027275_18750 [Rhabdobacter roseus]|uniref:Alpha-glucosidase (Family GH31 glycosyl hydrolase) n=1 Tax=Rhabdobacter roseus TaxID=1655419 RepID=A0A840TV12_9BACT|nr:glycoside hydrolase family 31 protein [Rhabdobacter roseus]MBB5283800.1 alpha-glucosidase (family GH31 glycosyl hydrolase) [Rhabdobacter roseus]